MSLFSSRNRGFTLIELLVVVAIIGILSSIVLASLNSARQKGRDARRISDIKQLQLALELSYDTNAEYPDTLASLATAGYISVIPTDPVGGASYGYSPLQSDGATACAVSTTCPSYVLQATLESSSNTALNSDIDTNPIGGLDCTDPAYCIKP